MILRFTLDSLMLRMFRISNMKLRMVYMLDQTTCFVCQMRFDLGTANRIPFSMQLNVTSLAYFMRDKHNHDITFGIEHNQRSVGNHNLYSCQSELLKRLHECRIHLSRIRNGRCCNLNAYLLFDICSFAQ